MCGIVSIFNIQEQSAELREQALRMSGKIRHRGPMNAFRSLTPSRAGNLYSVRIETKCLPSMARYTIIKTSAALITAVTRSARAATARSSYPSIVNGERTQATPRKPKPSRSYMLGSISLAASTPLRFMMCSAMNTSSHAIR